jgi:hypothetical protein
MEKATACFAKYDIDGTGEVSAWDIKVRLQKALIFDCMHASHPAYLQHTYIHIPTHTHQIYTHIFDESIFACRQYILCICTQHAYVKTRAHRKR